jgi:hypothetical protein
MKAYLVYAGKVRAQLCADCVKQMVADILGDLQSFTVEEVKSEDVSLLIFPWCDACDASFIGSAVKMEVPQ